MMSFWKLGGEKLLFVNRKLNQDFHSPSVPREGGIVSVTSTSEAARLWGRWLCQALQDEQLQVQVRPWTPLRPTCRCPAGDAAPGDARKQPHFTWGLQWLSDQPTETLRWKPFPFQENKNLQRPTIDLSKHCLRTRAIMPVLLIHYAYRLLLFFIFNSLGSFPKTLQNDKLMLCHRMSKTLDCTPHYENSKVLLEFPALFLCLPKHAPNATESCSHFLFPTPPAPGTPTHKLPRSSCHLSHMPRENAARHPQPPNCLGNKESNMHDSDHNGACGGKGGRQDSWEGLQISAPVCRPQLLLLVCTRYLSEAPGASREFRLRCNYWSKSRHGAYSIPNSIRNSHVGQFHFQPEKSFLYEWQL